MVVFGAGGMLQAWSMGCGCNACHLAQLCALPDLGIPYSRSFRLSKSGFWGCRFVSSGVTGVGTTFIRCAAQRGASSRGTPVSMLVRQWQRSLPRVVP